MKIVLIDTFGLFFRMFYAMSALKSSDGKPSGMVFGMANFILNLQKDFAADGVVFALDSGGETKRHEILPDYKANRQSPPSELKEQIPVCIEMIEKMGFCCVKQQGYEADDIIASFVKRYENDHKICIVTTDKDLHQLINKNVTIFNPAKKEVMDEVKTKLKFGVSPSQIRDYLALCGDASDNIPGVSGIGPTTAKKLLNEVGDLDFILANINLVKSTRTKNLLFEGAQMAQISKRLATLFDNLPLPPLENSAPPSEPFSKIEDILQSYSLQSIVQKLPSKTAQNAEFEAVCVDDDETLLQLTEGITSDTLIAFDTETTGVDVRGDKLVGFSFCFNKKRAFYVPLAHQKAAKQVSFSAACAAIRRIFSAYVVGHNLKFDFDIILHNCAILPPQNFADTMILAWLENPSAPLSMDSLAKRLWGYETIKFEQVVSRGENFSHASLDAAVKYAAEDAWVTLRFFLHFRKNLEPKLWQVANEVEFKILPILSKMQERGVEVQTQTLEELIASLQKQGEELKGEIFALAGEEFNLNSPSQLASVLFEKLALKSKKRTKTGFSTDESVLRGLLDEHPIIAKILDFREIFKLQSTYAQPLLTLAKEDENRRVRTTFVQTGTATGRLASKNPNLQNIPARSSLGKLVRGAFRAKEGSLLVSADYSQIELRLLAHFSEDERLCEAFFHGEDIHARSAVQIFGELTPQNRQVAKTINFGLIYGMGASKLAENLGISRAQAKDYIERYFAAFSSVSGFLERTKEQAKERGFAQTLLGRKRFFDFASADEMTLAAFLREAVNTTFQGSAADIIKLAMIRCEEEFGGGFVGFDGGLNLSKPNLSRAQMLLQIHDELIFEVEEGFVEEFCERVKGIMQGVVRLNVPLAVNVSSGKTWSELK